LTFKINVMDGLIEKLGIDWRLLAAQVVNFTLLLIILHSLLYKPVLEIFRKRSNIILRSIEESRKNKEGLKLLEQRKEKEAREARIAAKNIVSRAEILAKTQEGKILARAKGEREKLISEGKTIVKAQKDAMVKELEKEIGGLAVAVVEKFFNKGLTKNEHEKIVKNIISSI